MLSNSFRLSYRKSRAEGIRAADAFRFAKHNADRETFGLDFDYTGRAERIEGDFRFVFSAEWNDFGPLDEVTKKWHRVRDYETAPRFIEDGRKTFAALGYGDRGNLLYADVTGETPRDLFKEYRRMKYGRAAAWDAARNAFNRRIDYLRRAAEGRIGYSVVWCRAFVDGIEVASASFGGVDCDGFRDPYLIDVCRDFLAECRDEAIANVPKLAARLSAASL